MNEKKNDNLGLGLGQENRSTNIAANESTNGSIKIAAILKALGIITVISGLIAGFALGRDSYDDFSLISALVWWTGGFISGAFTYGFGEIISLLKRIANKY